ncbi:MAG: HupE/UreJ family protein [Myxococcales bacterium]
MTLAARASCRNEGPFELGVPFAGPPGHPLVVSARWGNGPASTWTVDATHPQVRIELAADAPGLGSFVPLGVRHIVSGWDHLVFLLGLLLATKSLKRLAVLVTAFTVAHSITLALAALSIVRVPERVVEPAIAASIVVVALLNVLKVERGGDRWLLAFAFGLVHGFGFASALAEAGLERAGLVRALVGFNVGVELGQALLVALAAPALAWMRRKEEFARVAWPALSLASLAVGAYWFLGRAFS